jgi:spermidine synthase
LHVSLKDGRLMLSTENAIYSYADKYYNFAEALGKLDYSHIQTCLILGFGLGSIPYIIEKTLDKELFYTGIEIDEEVIYLASKYVLPNLESDIQIIQADALTYVNLSQTKYDLILMDVFESDYIPLNFETSEFLEDLKSCLSNQGLVLYNRLATSKDETQKSFDFYRSIFAQVFPNSSYLRIKGNLMLSSLPIV